MRNQWTLVAGLAAVLVVSQALVSTPGALAQCTMPTPTCSTVGATAKGALGGGILGVEIGFMIPAIIVGAGARELDEAWAYILFPVVFGALGAIGGYYALEDSNIGSEPAVVVLAISMALIVPTFVGVLALTAYTPGPDTGGQGATGDEDAADEGTSDTIDEGQDSEEQSALQRTLAGGPGLFRYDRGQLLLGIPMVHTRPSYTPEEQEHMHLEQQADLNIPLVSGVF